MSATANVSVPLWSRWQFPLRSDSDAAPTTEVHLELTSPSGLRRTVAAFWDGADRWRAQFMPDEQGTWAYRSIAADDAAGLHDVHGQFTCTAPLARHRFDTHGPIGLSKDRRHFAHADGTPFFFLADTVWNGALMSTPQEWEAFLDDRQAKKFTAIQFVTHAPWVGAFSTVEGDVSYTHNARFPVNPAAFARIDQRIEAINAHGMLAVPVLIWAAPFGDAAAFNAGHVLPEEQLIALARHQVARFGANHVAWILAGDGRYEKESAAKWRHVGRAVFGERAGASAPSAAAQNGAVSPECAALRPRAPVMIHPMGLHWPYDEFRGESWLSALGYQSSHGDDANTLRWLQTGPASREWKLEPPRPIINLEPCYEGLLSWHSKRPFDALQVRRAIYWSLLNAPTAGVTYGAHGVWHWGSHARPALNHAGCGIAQPWQADMHLPGSGHMRHVADLFQSLPWWRLCPDPKRLADQPGTRDPQRFISAASTDDGCAIFYLPCGGELRLTTALQPDARCEWFDPRTGQRMPANGQTSFGAPDEQDWVLLAREGGSLKW